MSRTELFSLPDLKDSVGLRLTEEDKQNLRILMADRREAVVSNVIKACITEAAAPVRQRWQDSIDRREAAYDDDVAPDPAPDPDLSPEQ